MIFDWLIDWLIAYSLATFKSNLIKYILIVYDKRINNMKNKTRKK